LLARLDRTGKRVLCGVRDCGDDIARVIEDPRRWPLTNISEPGIFRVLLALEGWTTDGGELRKSTRAKKREAQGKDASLRRAYRPSATDRRANPGERPIGLPIRAECAKCGSWQTLDATALRVDGIRWRPSPPTVPQVDAPSTDAKVRELLQHIFEDGSGASP
jgi:hypothetical protein